MTVLLATLGTVFLTTFLASPTMGAGWFWDAGNGFGFAAFGGLLYIGITSFQRPDVRAHQMLAYTVLFVAVLHALWFLLVTIALMPDRLRVHKTYPVFRYWHRVLAVATVACCTHHIVVSNFYLATRYQAVLFIVLAAVASFWRAGWAKLGQTAIATPAAFLLLTTLLTGLFSAIRNLSL
jgi:hypothetical protein